MGDRSSEPSYAMQSGELPSVDPMFIEQFARSAPCPVIVGDLDERIIHANEILARPVLGMSAEDAKGRSYRDHFDADVCAYGRRLHACLAREGVAHTVISMLRGKFTRTVAFPVRVEGYGVLLMHMMRFGEPTAEAATARILEGVGTKPPEWCPVVDLGPLKELSRREATVLRALASGFAPAEIMSHTRESEHTFKARLERMDAKLGWGGLRGLVSHAYASGLHLYEEGYFQTVVLEALEPD